VLVVTAPGSGAEIIPFLKTWVNLPMAIGFTVLYAQVRNNFLSTFKHGADLFMVVNVRNK
jgi:AAA family ATP:ADP antiporter